MRITVFGSSAIKTPKIYLEESFQLGVLIAQHGYTCINGGGKNGVMGALNEGCRSKNGKIIGVIHSMFCVDGQEDEKLSELVIVDGNDLTERKQLLLDNGDCILIMPGGVGTFDEFWETVSAKSLGMKELQHKPICLVNINGFYNGFITQLHRAFDDQLLYLHATDYFHIVSNVNEAFEWCEAYHTSQLANENSEIDNKSFHKSPHTRILERMKSKKEDIKNSLDTSHGKYFTIISVGLAFSLGYLLASFRFNKSI